MQANAPTLRSPDVPAVVCAAITLAVAYGYTRVLALAAHPDAALSAYVEVARGLLQIGRALMVATTVLLVLRSVGVRIPSKLTRTVFTAGMVVGVPVVYVLIRWDAF